MTIPTTTQQQPIINKGNNTFAIKAKAFYGDPKVSFLEVASYSMNGAMLFYVCANMFSAWYLIDITKDNQGEKIMWFGAMLLLTQIVYNYLDLNSQNNLEKLEAFS